MEKALKKITLGLLIAFAVLLPTFAGTVIVTGGAQAEKSDVSGLDSKSVINSVKAKPATEPTPALETLKAASGAQVAAPVIKPVLQTWTVQARDITLSTTLTRWGHPGNYQVLWAASKDLPAMNATYQGSFEVALESLMEDTKHSGYPLHACLYNNKVVRILHATQSCDQ